MGRGKIAPFKYANELEEGKGLFRNRSIWLKAQAGSFLGSRHKVVNFT